MIRKRVRKKLGDKKQIPDDMELFRREMGDVRPLKANETTPSQASRPDSRPRQREQDERAVRRELLAEPPFEEGLETGEELLFLRPGYQRRYLVRLQRGRYSIQDQIDLHHMNVETARGVLLEFIEHNARSGLGCVRVVHGKGLRSRGRPWLKEMANHVLRRHPAVVAFASCRPVDGGTGAVAVLLRKQ
jgi:DNA-nicking Smr family endonuclease